MGQLNDLARDEQAAIVTMYVVGDESTGEVVAGPFPFYEGEEAANGLNSRAHTFPCRCQEAGVGREGCMARYHLAVVRRCRRCGCTEEKACAAGCYWVEQDLCSECHPDHKGKAAQLAVLREMGDFEF